MSDQEVVVVRDDSLGYEEPGKFALVRASEWCQYGDEVTLWRGPKKPDEKVETRHLTEVSCMTVHVDNDGFFTCALADPQVLTRCPQVSEDLIREVEEAAHRAMDVVSNQHEAETYSYVEHERLVEQLGDEWSDKIWAVATFGDGIAVNGEAADGRGDATPPKGWVELDHLGGRTDGGENEVFKEHIVGVVAADVSEKMKTPIDHNTVERVLDILFPEHDYVMWGSDYGRIDVWVSKAAARRLERLEEEEREREAERRRKAEEEERGRKEEQRRKEAQERREKIQRGGYPEPRDWSPRGRLPRED